MNFCNKIVDTLKLERTQIIISSVCHIVIEIALLAYYAQSSSNYPFSGDNTQKYFQLSIAGSVFMMISFLVIIVLNYYKQKYCNYFIVGFMAFSVFLLLIGIGLNGSTQYYDNQYNAGVAFWFIQLMLLILGYLNLLKLSNTAPNSKEKHAPTQTNQSFQQVPQHDQSAAQQQQ